MLQMQDIWLFERNATERTLLTLPPYSSHSAEHAGEEEPFTYLYTGARAKRSIPAGITQQLVYHMQMCVLLRAAAGRMGAKAHWALQILMPISRHHQVYADNPDQHLQWMKC